jgi:hypothetical protein
MSTTNRRQIGKSLAALRPGIEVPHMKGYSADVL